MKTAYRALILACILCGSPAVATDSNGGERSRALAFVRSESGIGERRFLRSIRREDIEEDVFNHQRKIPGDIKRATRIYEVTDVGWEIVSPSEAVRHSSTAPATWVVVVGMDEGPLFGLRGFSKAEVNFNALALFSKIALGSEAEASRWAEIYGSLVLSEEYGALVTSSRDLRRQVEDMEDGYRASRKVPFSAAQWLRGSQVAKIGYGLHVAVDQHGYVVTFPMLAQSDDGKHIPVLREIQTALAQNGTFSRKTVETQH